MASVSTSTVKTHLRNLYVSSASTAGPMRSKSAHAGPPARAVRALHADPQQLLG